MLAKTLRLAPHARELLLIVLALAAGFGQARAAKKEEIQDFAIPPGWQLQLVVESPPVFTEHGGFDGVIAALSYDFIPQGSQAIEHAIRIGDVTYGLVPYRTADKGGPRSWEPSKGHTQWAQCDGWADMYVPIDLERATVYPRLVHVYNQVCPTRRDGSNASKRVVSLWTQLRIEKPGTIRLEGARSDTEANRVAGVEQERMLALARERAAKAVAEIPRKREIGARICRLERNVTYVGYTEKVSPDNGKIQIRVAKAYLTDSPNLAPGGFREEILWDVPENWELCN